MWTASVDPSCWLAKNRLFSCIPLPQMPLWGFTYRLIADWLKLIAGDGSHFIEQVAARLKGARAGEAEGLLTGAWNEIPAVNMVEIRNDGVLVTDLQLQDFWIPLRKGGK